jgi:predicted metal-dependent phosphoesterase TrpH
VRSAIERGINCICITDHDEVQGSIEAMKLAYDKDILVIPGIEVSSKSGEVLGINVKKIVPNGLSVERTVEEIKKQGGISIIPHPFGWPLPVESWKKEDRKLICRANGAEAFNASLIFNFSNRRAFNFCQKNNLAYTAGSDAHHARFVGRGYIEVEKEISSEKDLITEILAKRVKIGGKSLSFFELLQNGSRGDAGQVFRFYFRQMKNRVFRIKES